MRTVVREQADCVSIGAVAWATYYIGLPRDVRDAVSFRPLDSEIDRALELKLIRLANVLTETTAFVLTSKGVQLLTLLGIQTEESRG